MSTELATTGGGTAIAQRGGRPKIMAEVLKEEGEQRKLLGQYIQQHMIEGVDFGVIPGTERQGKPGTKTLLKPGAEKLTDLFRCVPEYEMVERIEDWDRPLIHYLFRCRIISRDTGSVVAEGFGSCNSRESKYRYRNGDRRCPECKAAAILRSKYPPKDDPDAPPGWYCFAKKGGCGTNFDHDDPDITDQVAGKVENPDVADAANTILKMAKKRAQVDAVIALARCSDMFTQDVEDFQDDAPAQPVQTPRQQSGGKAVSPPPLAAPPPAIWTKDQFGALLVSKGWTWGGAVRAIDENQGTDFAGDKSGFADVPGPIVNDFAAWLQGQPDKPAAKPAAPAAPTPSATVLSEAAFTVIADIGGTNNQFELDAVADSLAGKTFTSDELKAIRAAWANQKQKLQPAATAA